MSFKLKNPVEVSCEVWEVLIQSEDTKTYSSLTDGHGTYGEPKHFTGIGLKDRDIFIGESTLYAPLGDSRCVHYVEGRAK